MLSKSRVTALRHARKKNHNDACKVQIVKTVPLVTVWHHLTSFVICQSDTQDRFVYPPLTLIKIFIFLPITLGVGAMVTNDWSIITRECKIFMYFKSNIKIGLDVGRWCCKKGVVYSVCLNTYMF